MVCDLDGAVLGYMKKIAAHCVNDNSSLGNTGQPSRWIVRSKSAEMVLQVFSRSCKRFLKQVWQLVLDESVIHIEANPQIVCWHEQHARIWLMLKL